MYSYVSQTTITDTANTENLLNLKNISDFCSNNQLMSRWYLTNIDDTNFQMNVICKSYNYGSLSCNDYYTDYNEANNVGLVHLDRHNVACNKDEGMQGFKAKSRVVS